MVILAPCSRHAVASAVWIALSLPWLGAYPDFDIGRYTLITRTGFEYSQEVVGLR